MDIMNTVHGMEEAFTMQIEFLKAIRKLIAYDKESAVPDNTKMLEAFCDTQERALDKAMVLIEKHRESLEIIEKQDREKQEKQHKLEEAKRKSQKRQEQEKVAVEKDLEKAKTDEDSLFADLSDGTGEGK